ncbi:MAG: DUF2490 domain-containing protein [Ferruginibacter sp.]|nr:DUF2490 domain-containing protein [Ferruginibacter sp.]
MKIFKINLLIFCFSVNATAQINTIGSWNILNIKYNLNEKWSVFSEAQLRSLKFYNNFHYYEYKGGVDFKLNKYLKLSLGAGSYQTYREGGDFVKPKANDELRIWPQILLFQSIGNFKIEQRYRSEFRFTSNGFRNRFRYRLGLSHPLGKKKNGDSPFQFSVSNEIFLTNNEPYFERNRFLLALNYKPSTASTFQLGYIHQLDYKINDETGRQFFQIGYFLELSRKNVNLNVENDLKEID